jgi:hypothetical protein
MSTLPNPKDFEDDDKTIMGGQLAGHEAETAGTSNGNKFEESLSVTRGPIRVPSPDPSLLSIDDSNNIRYEHSPDYVPDQIGSRYTPRPPRTLKGRVQALWYRNKGVFLVLISQLFGTLMNITTRLLEMEGNDGAKTINISSKVANCPIRQGISPIPHTLRPYGNHSPVCLSVYVVQEDRTLSLWHERSPIFTDRSRILRVLRYFRNVL